jgi:hypothetical protein
MNEEIGELAGKVWQTLGLRGEISLTQLPKVMKSKNDVTFQALGWLARENKVSYIRKSGKTFVTLSDPEKNVFSHLN